MISVTLFDEFRAASGASADALAILEELAGIRHRLSARFVNFSIHDYAKENPDVIHFLTYPREWLVLYAQRSYSKIDPLLAADYRRVSHIDWREAHAQPEQMAMFEAMAQQSVGNEAVTLACHAGGNVHTSLSLVFRCAPRDWPSLKSRGMASFRLECERLTRRYSEIGLHHRTARPRLTQREREVLRLAAHGKTDRQIASQMGLARWTVVSHIQSAKFKLDCPNRTAAVARAITLELIELEEPPGQRHRPIGVSRVPQGN